MKSVASCAPEIDVGVNPADCQWITITGETLSVWIRRLIHNIGCAKGAEKIYSYKFFCLSMHL